MRPITDLTTLARTKKKKSLSDQLERLRITLGYDEKLWCEIMGISTADYIEFRKNQKDLTILALLQVADHFELTLESIMNDHVDYQVVSARHAGNKTILPQRYLEGAGSRRRSSLNLLNATEEFLGWRARAMAMRHLQVTEAAFANPDDLINLRFNTDLCDYLSRNYGGAHLFYQLGAYSLVNNMNTPIGTVMAQSASVKNAHLQFIEEMVAKHWEKNFSYKIVKLTDTLCIAEGVPNPDIADSLKIRNPGSTAVCQTKVGITSAIPGYMGLPFSHTEEIKCVHRGDEKCVYEMDFEHAAQSLKFLDGRGGQSMAHSH
jgi:hypothetical protein